MHVLLCCIAMALWNNVYHVVYINTTFAVLDSGWCICSLLLGDLYIVHVYS